MLREFESTVMPAPLQLGIRVALIDHDEQSWALTKGLQLQLGHVEEKGYVAADSRVSRVVRF